MRAAVPTDAPPETALEAAFPPAFGFVVATQFVFGLAVSTYAILPSVVIRHLHGTSDDVGLASGLLAFGALAASPFAGLALDRFGRRRMVFAGSLATALASSSFALLLDHEAYALPLLVLVGMAAVLVVNGVITIVADLAPPQALGRAVGWQGAATMLANAVAPTIAERLGPALSWHAPFYGSALIAAATALMALRLPEDPPRAAHAERPRGSAWKTTLSLAPILLVAFLSGATYTAIATFQQPHVIAQGATSVKAYFMGFSAGALLMRLGFGSLPDRLGHVRSTRLSLAAYTLVALAFAAIGPLTLGLGGFGHGLAHGVFYPSLMALAFRTADANGRGLAATITNGAFNGGSALSAFALGRLAQEAGTSSVFVVGALSVATAIVFVRPPKERA